jgi:transposase
MRALDPEVKDAIWAGLEPHLPPRVDRHPLGCHRPRCSDRDCFDLIVVRLATGCSWEDAERLTGNKVSDTTARARRDEWIAAGALAALSEEALAGFDKVIGLELSDVAVDGSLHKSPCGGDGTGKNPTDRAKLGWKWSILTDRYGIPFGWTVDGANRNDSVMLEPTLDDAGARGLLADIETIWLDRGYDSEVTRQRLAERLLDDAIIAKKRKRGEAKGKNPQPMGMRWPVERTNAWLAAYGQLRRNTDRNPIHRLAQFALAVAFMLTAKLIDYRFRWSRMSVPIR